MEDTDQVFLLLGVGAFLAAILPRVLRTKPVSEPIVFLGLGLIAGLMLPQLDPLRNVEVVEHLTELVVIVALMGAGLKLRKAARRRWKNTARLLIVTMPVSILLVAMLGAWAGLGIAAALLLAAALAPTDPVLASEVQVGKPGNGESRDEVRFTLTGEAGLNDGLAFPFVYAAILLNQKPAKEWWVHWVTWEVTYKIMVGVVAGILVGKLLGALMFKARPDAPRLSQHSEGFVAVAATFLAYGATELVGGYGFLAVFMTGLMIRRAEEDHEYHKVLHNFSEQIERLLTVIVMLLLGAAISDGMLSTLTWSLAGAAVAGVLVVRPLVARGSLIGGEGSNAEKWVIATFGIRGIGTLYYLAYGIGHGIGYGDQLWAAAGLAVVVSVVVHGVSATPAMTWLEKQREKPG